MATPTSSDSRRPRNPYERLRREFLEAHDDFGGFRVKAYPLKETCKRRPPDFGLCELPGIEGFSSATYGLYAASSKDDALVSDEFAKSLERFRSLANRAGDLLPMCIRDVLPDGGAGTVGVWIRLLWYFGLPGRSDRAKLEWHFQQVGRGILSTCDGWLSPFRTSSVAIERCRLDTDSPAFFRLDEILGLATKAVPAISGASTEDASRTAASQERDAEPTPTIISMGNGCYRIGNSEPIKVSDKEDVILQSFIGRPAMSGPDLQNRSGYDRGREVLKALQVKYGRVFAEAIKLPGGKAGGGYRVSIRAMDAQ